MSTHTKLTLMMESRDDPNTTVTQHIMIRTDLLEIPDPKKQHAAQVITTQRVAELFGQLYQAACPRPQTE